MIWGVSNAHPCAMTPICAILELLPPGGGESDSDVEVLEGDSDVELVDEPGDGDAEGKMVEL